MRFCCGKKRKVSVAQCTWASGKPCTTRYKHSVQCATGVQRDRSISSRDCLSDFCLQRSSYQPQPAAIRLAWLAGWYWL